MTVGDLEGKVYFPKSENEGREVVPAPRSRVMMHINAIKDATKRIREIIYQLPL
jgi:hypothetical protein